MNFVNLDEIGRGLSPLDPTLAEREAARIALSRAHDFIQGREIFSMETTLSGHVHLALMNEARLAGLSPALLFFSVRTPEICLERIARRVAEGGHDVAEQVVRRRFVRSHANLSLYCGIADLWRIYEASGPKPCLALEGNRGTTVHIDPVCLATANAMVQDFASGIPNASDAQE
jgi:predicted ABC-type ATPase